MVQEVYFLLHKDFSQTLCSQFESTPSCFTHFGSELKKAFNLFLSPPPTPFKYVKKIIIILNALWSKWLRFVPH